MSSQQEYEILIKVQDELEGIKKTVEAFKETSNEANLLKNTLQIVKNKHYSYT